MIVNVTPKSAPATLSELVHSSPVVVVANCIRSLQSRLPAGAAPDSVPVTDHLFRITESLKGKMAVGEELLVTQTGGTWKDSDFVVSGLVQFAPGDEVVLFLLPSNEKILTPNDPPRHYINGLWAGVFPVRENYITVTRDSTESLKRYSGLEKASFLVLVRDELLKGPIL